jgi:hypothetical protein
MSEDRLMRIFGTNMEEVGGGWRRPHNEKLHSLHASPNIIRVITSRRMRLERHMVYMEEMRNEYGILF